MWLQGSATSRVRKLGVAARGAAMGSFGRAAEAVASADALLITTGAGMGVDSGLGTFRGRNAGVWRAAASL